MKRVADLTAEAAAAGDASQTAEALTRN